jgi:hypothetical protein
MANLIGPNARIRPSLIYNIVQVSSLPIPEEPIEVPFGEGSHSAIWLRPGRPRVLGQICHDARPVVPQGLNFDSPARGAA